VRRSLIITVAAAVGMVLLAMMVPMAFLMRDYALEDRLSEAALEVQATETVVAAQDQGSVAFYIDQINDGDDGITTTVLYPGDTKDIGPDQGEDDRVAQVRDTGIARVDDVDGGTQLLVPVSRGGNTPAAESTAVIRVIVEAPGPDSELFGGLLVLLLLGLALVVGALLVADRLGRTFVEPIRAVAAHAGRLGAAGESVTDVEPVAVTGPPEVRELATALNRLVARIQTLLAREREANADISHRLRTPVTALRLRADGLADPEERQRLSADLDELQATIDAVIREARRSEREGLVASTDAVAVVRDRVEYWRLLADEQERDLDAELPATAIPVRASEEDLAALVDVLLDNVFTLAPPRAAARVRVTSRAEGGARIVVEDGGPGFPEGVDIHDRGVSGAGSTGLGLAIVAQTAALSGGGLRVDASELGGARVIVDLGGA
jgi:signal transduction histidine kinase